jgi:NAD dependent epimerase/dehydratase family enzyme
MTRAGLGGTLAGGRQYVSWIHALDFARAVTWLIEHDTLVGPVNVAAPEPLPQAEFARQLRRAAGVPIGLPATRWMLQLGAVFLRTDVELVLKSRRVVPGRLAAAGFSFEFPRWEAAARDLVARARAESAR